MSSIISLESIKSHHNSYLYKVCRHFIFVPNLVTNLSRMSYQPSKENELVIGILQTSDTPETHTEEKRSPRHSICSSLLLAVIAHCCCIGLGIIPLVIVMIAYVKRETGKYKDARRLNQLSKNVFFLR